MYQKRTQRFKKKEIVQKNEPVRVITYTKTHCICRVVVFCDKEYNKTLCSNLEQLYSGSFNGLGCTYE